MHREIGRDATDQSQVEVAGARRALEQKPLPGSSLRVLGVEPTTDGLGRPYGVMAWCDASLSVCGWMDAAEVTRPFSSAQPPALLLAHLCIHGKSCPGDGCPCRLHKVEATDSPIPTTFRQHSVIIHVCDLPFHFQVAFER